MRSAIIVLITLVLVSVCVSGTQNTKDDKKSCGGNSRYDFLENLLERVLRMELWVETMTTRVDADLDRFGNSIEGCATELGKMKTFMGDVSRDYSAFEEKAENRLVGMEERSREATLNMQRRMGNAEPYRAPNVMFHVKDVDGQPGSDSLIKFTTTVYNTGAYDIDTGCFRAPVHGAYWFSAQLCSNYNKDLSPSIWIRGNLASRVFSRDSDHANCVTVQVVSTLEVDENVCLMTSSYMGSPAFHKSPNYLQNNFMGSLINGPFP